MQSKFLTLPFCLFLAAAIFADEPELKTVEKPPTARLKTVPQPPTAYHGTAVEFVESPVEAAKLAKKEKKLVLVLHVSGYFEDPDFT